MTDNVITRIFIPAIFISVILILRAIDKNFFSWGTLWTILIAGVAGILVAELQLRVWGPIKLRK